MAGPGPTKNLLMGRIGAAHGIRGEVRIQSFTENPLDIAAYGPLLTKKDGITVEIVKSRLSKNMVIATLKGVTDRNAAEKLNGTELFIERDRLPPEDDADDFYLADLIGLEARRTDGSVMGTVSDVPDYGAGDLIEIAPQDGNGNSLLFAFTRENVPEVNIAEGYLTIEPPSEVEVREGKADDRSGDPQ